MVGTTQKEKDFSRMRRVYLRDWREHRRQQAKGLTEKKRWSLPAVAARIGVDQSYLGKVERGIRQYNEAMLEALAQEYKCTPVELLSRRPSDPEDLWTIVQQLREPQRQAARGYLERLRDEAQLTQ